MALPVVLGLCVLLFQNALSADDDVKGPPTVDGSFIAVGEVVVKISEDGFKSQTKFDETFDINTGSAAFTIQELGMNVSFYEDALTGQTFRYFNGGCSVITVEEWIDVPVPPSLAGYKEGDGKIRFSLKQLFNVSDRHLLPKEAGKSTTFRGIDAQSWTYELKSNLEDGNTSTVNIYAYWSDKSWTTTSSYGQPIPLGYKITQIISDKFDKRMIIAEQYLNVFSFIHDAVDLKQLEPRQGIECVGRNPTFTFPVMSEATAISFRSEVIFPDETEVKTMDVFLDMKNGYYRVNLDRLDTQDPTEKSRSWTSDITSKTIETTYFVDVAKGGLKCEVKPTEQYTWDYQEIINPKLKLQEWTISTLFGKGATNYTYIGKTTKRSIPCHLFQGVRYDWPVPEVKVRSLWEWCVTAALSDEPEMMNFRDGEIGVVSAQIWFNQSDPKISEKENATIVHNFYDFTEEDPDNLNVSTFDVSWCYNPDQQRRVEFSVELKIDSKNMDAVENATSDIVFLGAWKAAIGEKSGLPANRLRVSRVKSMVWDNVLTVSVTILGVHPDLAKENEQNKPSLEDAIKALNASINNSDLKIKYAWTKTKLETLTAEKNSLHDIIKVPDEVPTPEPTIGDGSTTTLIPFSLITSDGSTTDDGGDKKSTNDGSTTPGTGVSESPLVKKVYTGHASGTVAGVSIAMLLVGLTLGVGGTFYKYRGIPCVR